MSERDGISPSLDLPSRLISTSESQAPGDQIEKSASPPNLDHVFNFQIVVFQVYISCLHCKSSMKKQSQHVSIRSRIRSFRLLGMVLTFREPLSHYRRHQWTVLKGAALKIPSIYRESRRTTFGPSCACYIHCAF